MPFIDLNKLTPSLFPTVEDDQYEFKSSQTPPGELKKKLSKAASGFANSGGGCFIWGVNDETGNPDGGVQADVRGQELKAWIDQTIKEVSPPIEYSVQLYDDNEGRGTLNTGKVIAAVSIHPSAVGTHMAYDNRYYIRAGRHTLPANHSIVEALWARRQIGKPVLSHVLRHKPTRTTVVQLGIVALTEAPAVDVRISIAPLKQHMVEMFPDLPIHVSVINHSNPYYLDVTTTVDVVKEFDEEVKLEVEYRDLNGNTYVHTNKSAIYKDLQPMRIGIDGPLDEIADALKNISSRLDQWSWKNDENKP